MIDLQNLMRLGGIKLKTKVDDRGYSHYRLFYKFWRTYLRMCNGMCDYRWL